MHYHQFGVCSIVYIYVNNKGRLFVSGIVSFDSPKNYPHFRMVINTSKVITMMVIFTCPVK